MLFREHEFFLLVKMIRHVKHFDQDKKGTLYRENHTTSAEEDYKNLRPNIKNVVTLHGSKKCSQK